MTISRPVQCRSELYQARRELNRQEKKTYPMEVDHPKPIPCGIGISIVHKEPIKLDVNTTSYSITEWMKTGQASPWKQK